MPPSGKTKRLQPRVTPTRSTPPRTEHSYAPPPRPLPRPVPKPAPRRTVDLRSPETQAFVRRALASPQPDHQAETRVLGAKNKALLDQHRANFQANVRKSIEYRLQPVSHENIPTPPVTASPAARRHWEQ